VIGKPGHALQPFQAVQHVLLLIQDFSLDFGRGGTEPIGADRDDGTVHIRRELDRD